jgi:hypothetical protein
MQEEQEVLGSSAGPVSWERQRDASLAGDGKQKRRALVGPKRLTRGTSVACPTRWTCMWAREYAWRSQAGHLIDGSGAGMATARARENRRLPVRPSSGPCKQGARDEAGRTQLRGTLPRVLQTLGSVPPGRESASEIL